jgi:hypothetical protein
VRGTLVVPAGTTAAAPATLAVPVGWVLLDSLELIVPDGHAGFTGFALSYKGAQLWPWPVGAAQWYTANDHTVTVTLDDYEVTDPVTLSGYNVGNYQHTFYASLLVHDVPAPAQPAVSALVIPGGS